MILKIQIFSLFFSFVYGVFFAVLVKLNHKVLFNVKRHIQVISNFFFLLDVSLCYFLCIKYINNGALHIYFLLLFFLGWYIGCLILDKFIKK